SSVKRSKERSLEEAVQLLRQISEAQLRGMEKEHLLLLVRLLLSLQLEMVSISTACRKVDQCCNRDTRLLAGTAVAMLMNTASESRVAGAAAWDLLQASYPRMYPVHVCFDQHLISNVGLAVQEAAKNRSEYFKPCQLAVGVLQVRCHPAGKDGVERLAVSRGLLTCCPPHVLLSPNQNSTQVQVHAEFYKCLIQQQRRELPASLTELDLAGRWAKSWQPFLLEALTSEVTLLQTNSSTHLLPCTFQVFSSAVHHLLASLNPHRPGHLHAWACILSSYRAISGCSPWDLQGSSTFKTLQLALGSADDKTRLAALNLLCYSSKTRDIPSTEEMKILKEFIPQNLNCESSPFRQHLQAALRRFLIRELSAGMLLRFFPPGFLADIAEVLERRSRQLLCSPRVQEAQMGALMMKILLQNIVEAGPTQHSMSPAAFFFHYPELQPFLLGELRGEAQHLQRPTGGAKLHLQPSLYLILTLLAQLQPGIQDSSE
ncbi:hypothetical protein GOODEAATRI_005586, partial [Goodea atripinnis]